jgi:hypothetical protein
MPIVGHDRGCPLQRARCVRGQRIRKAGIRRVWPIRILRHRRAFGRLPQVPVARSDRCRGTPRRRSSDSETRSTDRAVCSLRSAWAGYLALPCVTTITLPAGPNRSRWSPTNRSKALRPTRKATDLTSEDPAIRSGQPVRDHVSGVNSRSTAQYRAATVPIVDAGSQPSPETQLGECCNRPATCHLSWRVSC